MPRFKTPISRNITSFGTRIYQAERIDNDRQYIFICELNPVRVLQSLPPPFSISLSLSLFFSHSFFLFFSLARFFFNSYFFLFLQPLLVYITVFFFSLANIVFISYSLLFSFFFLIILFHYFLSLFLFSCLPNIALHPPSHPGLIHPLHLLLILLLLLLLLVSHPPL